MGASKIRLAIMGSRSMTPMHFAALPVAAALSGIQARRLMAQSEPAFDDGTVNLRS